VTADDFGRSDAVNAAVDAAARGGILTAASLMVAAPGAADAIRRARALPELRVGLHLVLADGWAALAPAAIPGLVDRDGRFPDRMVRDGFRFFASRSLRRQLEAEIHAQFRAYERSGLALDHVNAHKHFHLHPTLLEMMLRIGRDFGMNAVRVPREPSWFVRRHGGRWAALVNDALLGPWLALLEERLRAASLAFNDQVFGLATSGRTNEAVLHSVLEQLPPGVSEIYLHPAMDDHAHGDELAALVSPRVRAALERAAVPQGGFQDSIRYRAVATIPGT
jgi:hopanoid biosynthesis associated protein HpnK